MEGFPTWYYICAELIPFPTLPPPRNIRPGTIPDLFHRFCAGFGPFSNWPLAFASPCGSFAFGGSVLRGPTARAVSVSLASIFLFSIKSQEKECDMLVQATRALHSLIASRVRAPRPVCHFRSPLFDTLLLFGHVSRFRMYDCGEVFQLGGSPPFLTTSTQGRLRIS